MTGTFTIPRGRNIGLKDDTIYMNDEGAAEIWIGLKEFHCAGASPPHDHPTVYLNMGEEETILCPYCATQFRFYPAPRERAAAA